MSGPGANAAEVTTPRDPETDQITETGIPVSTKPQPEAAQTEPGHSPAWNLGAEPEAVESSAQNPQSPSINDEASPEAGPQAEASPGREQVTGTLAGREGRSEGEAASADLPTHSPETAVDCPQPPGSDRWLSAAGSGDAIGGQPVVTPKPDADVSGGVTVGGDESGTAAPTSLLDARIRNTLRLRPGCRKPEICGASGPDHCFSCRAAMAAGSAA